MDLLAKGLNFIISTQEISVVELITSTETFIRSNNLTEPEAEHLRIKVTVTFSNASFKSHTTEQISYYIS